MVVGDVTVRWEDKRQSRYQAGSLSLSLSLSLWSRSCSCSCRCRFVRVRVRVRLSSFKIAAEEEPFTRCQISEGLRTLLTSLFHSRAINDPHPEMLRRVAHEPGPHLVQDLGKVGRGRTRRAELDLLDGVGLEDGEGAAEHCDGALFFRR